MKGPYSLRKLDALVETCMIGAYVLSRGGQRVHYVGRSDSNLRARIQQSAKLDGYTHFWFGYASSPMQGFKAECQLWHRFQPVDNENHPAVPAGANWRCPVRGCQWS